MADPVHSAMPLCQLCDPVGVGIRGSPHNGVQGAATALSDSIDRNTPAKVPDRCSEAPSVAGVERILALAHRLSYTSFAPPGACPGSARRDWGSGAHCPPGWDHYRQAVTPCMGVEVTAHGSERARFCLAGFVPGVTPLGVFRPPAPQDGQMQAAQLHQFAGAMPALHLLPMCQPLLPQVTGGVAFASSTSAQPLPTVRLPCLQLSTSRPSFEGRGSCRQQWQSSLPCLSLPSSHPRCSPAYPACRQVWFSLEVLAGDLTMDKASCELFSGRQTRDSAPFECLALQAGSRATPCQSSRCRHRQSCWSRAAHFLPQMLPQLHLQRQQQQYHSTRQQLRKSRSVQCLMPASWF